MPGRMPKNTTIAKASNGTNAVVVGAADVRGLASITVHVDNASAGQAATLRFYCSPTATTAPTATTGLYPICTQAAGAIDTFVCAAASKAAFRLSGLSTNFILVTSTLAGAGTETITCVIQGNVASLGGGVIIP